MNKKEDLNSDILKNYYMFSTINKHLKAWIIYLYYLKIK